MIVVGMSDKKAFTVISLLKRTWLITINIVIYGYKFWYSFDKFFYNGLIFTTLTTTSYFLWAGLFTNRRLEPLVPILAYLNVKEKREFVY